MMLLVSGATRTMERLAKAGPPNLGALNTPGTKNCLRRVIRWGLPWAVDNGAFSGFDAPAFLRLLASAAGKPGCLFVAAPDVVCDAAATLRQFDQWEPAIHAIGLPVALVAQNGLEDLAVPWERMDAFFVGGDTAWKLGPAAYDLCREAKARGKWVHVGRVNSLRRIHRVAEMGADSMDGTRFSRWPDTHIPDGLRWIEEVERERQQQARLFA